MVLKEEFLFGSDLVRQACLSGLETKGQNVFGRKQYGTKMSQLQMRLCEKVVREEVRDDGRCKLSTVPQPQPQLQTDVKKFCERIKNRFGAIAQSGCGSCQTERIAKKVSEISNHFLLKILPKCAQIGANLPPSESFVFHDAQMQTQPS